MAFNFLSILLLLFTIIPISISQTPRTPAPPPPEDACNGVFITYTYKDGSRLPPVNPTRQAYRFESTLTVLNNGLEELKSWRVFVGFQHEEFLVSASGAVLADGSSLPANVENGTVFAGFPMTDLKTAVATAGDKTQMQVEVELVGTQFGVAPPTSPLPRNISLANDGFSCLANTRQGRNSLQVCCTKNKNARTNITVDEEFSSREKGDLTIMYDIIRPYDSNYWSEVTIRNHNPLGRLDNWKLSFDWMHDEFIYSMKGAYPSIADSSGCLYGPQGTYYKELDFSSVLNCERRPTIIDLPPTMFNNTELGKIPFCCRNGTLLPPSMDPSMSTAAFQMQVFKMPPDLNRSQLSPPQNWRINGTLNPSYQCGPPVRVSPSHFPDPSGLSNRTAFASWQVVCNITRPRGARPKCCVSFSAYYNDSVIPCRTCACGCPSNVGRTCSTTSPAVLLPAEALLVPFDNRTTLARAWSDLNHRTVPNPMPCGDNCGVSINWHLATDYNRGWTARVTLFNWAETAFPDWFTAVQLDKAGPGFERAYSFNGSLLADTKNTTIIMQGMEGLNFLVGETDGPNPARDPRVPGKQQSVISFNKRRTPGINVPLRDGFPTKVFFNGEECSLPTIIPMSDGSRTGSTLIFTIAVAVIVFLTMQQ